MRTEANAFSAKVELPCSVFCGPDSLLEFSGMAVSIDTGRLVLALRQGNSRPWPEIGERVRLELLLPVDDGNSGPARCLDVRARVERVTEMPDGSRQIGLTFRRASFKDLDGSLRRTAAKTETNRWEM